jgi:RNA polymerase sigma-70 factor (ECF subfamily)
MGSLRGDELALAFIDASDGALPSAALGERLAGALAAARRRWPEVGFDDARFVAHVARRAADADALEALHLEDLYLAGACVAGAPGAIEAFDRQLLGQVPTFVARYGLTAELLDELRQRLRIKLLVGEAGTAPRIEQYSGRGTLQSWVCAAAVRMAIDLQRLVVDSEPLDAPLALADDDVELAYLRSQYAGEFRAALTAALAALAPRQRNLLRFYYLERLTLDKLARLHDVHATTVMRWLSEIRAVILDACRERLRARLQLSDSEFDSLLHVLRSDLHISVRQLLAAEG